MNYDMTRVNRALLEDYAKIALLHGGADISPELYQIARQAEVKEEALRTQFEKALANTDFGACVDGIVEVDGTGEKFHVSKGKVTSLTPKRSK